MKKIIIALFLLVVAAVAAGPFLIGSKIEDITKQLVVKGNQQLSDAVQSNPQLQSGSLVIDDYKKGYLKSEAKGVLMLSLAGFNGGNEFKIPFKTDITHGPYLGDAGAGLAKSVTRPDLSDLDLPESINDDTFIIESIVDFSQGLTEILTVAPIKDVGESGNIIDFAGATIHSKSTLQNRLTFTANMQVKQLMMGSSEAPNAFVLKPFQLDASGKGDEQVQAGTYQVESSPIEVTIESEETKVVLQKMAVMGNYKQANGADIMLGDSQLNVTDLVITNAALPDPIKVPEFKFSSTIDQAKNNDLNVTAKYQGTLDPSLMALMNSPIDVKTAEIDIQFKAIPITVVTEYQQIMEDLMADPEQAADKTQAKMLELVQKLAKNSASTHLNVLAKAQEGELIADIDTGFKPGVNFDSAQMMQLLAAPDPSTILRLLVGRGNVSLSKGITDKAGITPMIQMMAADFVTLKDDKFVAELQINDDQLLINGTPLPLAPQ